MKNFSKILLMLALAAFFATGCVNEEPHYKKEPGTTTPSEDNGYLALGGMTVRVVYDEDQIDTRPDEATEQNAPRQAPVTRATPNVGDFIVEIFDAADQSVLGPMTYTELQAELAEPKAMPVGAYRLEVRSAQTIPAAEWEQPFYGASENFDILKKQEPTEIGEVVCTLQNIKVTVDYDPTLLGMLSGTTKATVSIGDNKIDFAKGETRAAYMQAVAAENTIKFALNGTYADTGGEVTLSRTITGVKAGQWRKISVKIESADKGKMQISLVVDGLIQNSDITVDGSEGLWEPVIDDNTGAPTVAWPGHDLSKPFQLTAAMFDKEGNCTEPFVFNFESPNGIQSLNVKIGSTSSAFLASLASIQIPISFDLCTLEAGSPAGIILKGFGYPLGDQIKGYTTKSFDIAGQMSLLYGFEGTHTFAFQVTDTNNRSTAATLTIQVDKQQSGGSTIVWRQFDIDQQQTVTADMLVDVDVTAAAGIRSFRVTIDSEELTPLLPVIGMPSSFDLCNIEGDLVGMLKDEFGFPINEQVKDQTSVGFNLNKFIPILLEIPGEHNFVLDVTDNNGVALNKAIQLIVKE